jgi:acetyl-CoA acyltransferase
MANAWTASASYLNNIFLSVEYMGAKIKGFNWLFLQLILIFIYLRCTKFSFMQEAYIVAGYRTAVGKSKRGGFRFTRPDDLAIEVIQSLLKTVPQLDPKRVDDVIVGNAVPEAEQGLQVGRIIAAKAVGFHAPGMTVNRYCASGLETIAIATSKIRMGMAECIIAGGTGKYEYGTEQAGWKTVPAYSIAKDEPDYYLSMGLTAGSCGKRI